MILSDTDIKSAVRRGDVAVEPFNEVAVQPASLDLRLGNAFSYFIARSFRPSTGRIQVIDPTEDVRELMATHICQEYLIQPRELVLGVTQEKITLSNSIVARVEGKSSLGRLGLIVHATAGFIDPGFSGYITLEMYNMAPHPIRLRPGMWIAQLAFTPLVTSCAVPYGKQRGSRYVDAGDACVPTASRVHEKVA